jgi:hypothetical protein
MSHMACLQVEDPLGHVLFTKHGTASGQFAFTTKEDGDFKACFSAKGARCALLLRPLLSDLRTLFSCLRACPV